MQPALDDGESSLDFFLKRAGVGAGVPVTDGGRERPHESGGDHLDLELVGAASRRAGERIRDGPSEIIDLLRPGGP